MVHFTNEFAEKYKIQSTVIDKLAGMDLETEEAFTMLYKITKRIMIRIEKYNFCKAMKNLGYNDLMVTFSDLK